ncbi:VWA domain-containing protein [Candidatus Parabeggiatoa sp. HSG14]|uniref:VWA domain-containing protein n=1 Tax=Candidatus Parabeggiatoa sp. HSG14 TaxID=3055593 RepID=UPI0025A91DD6|nr:VWA domain-containing protein [Thiotrichales bacterium HSG14]
MNTTNILDNGELALFIESLRLANYDISTTEFLAAQELIVALAAQGKLPKTLAPLKTLLMPTLCHSPKEQEDFSWHFDNWLNSVENVKPEPKPKKLTFLQLAWQKIKHAVKNLKWFLFFASFALILLTAIPDDFDISRKIANFIKSPTTTPSQPIEINPNTDDSPIPTPNISTEPISDLPENTGFTDKADFTENQPYEQEWWVIVLLLLLPLSALLWYLWYRYIAQPSLTRQTTSQRPKITQLFAKNINEKIFQSVGLTRVAQQLRKHTPIASDSLDLKATIKRTIKAGGWFTPVTGFAKTIPEYLVLIDRTTFKDHHSHFIDALINQLINQGVFVARYYFDGDPRHCYPEKDELPPQLLTELGDHYPAHRLLMFSDGDGFIDPITGNIVPWIEQFSVWTQKTFFTLEQPGKWGYQEKLLEKANFLIRTVPVNEHDLTTLAEQIKAEIGQPDNFKPKQFTGDASTFPTYFNDFSHWWLERHAPERAKVTELLKQVRDFLGEDGYYWFSACAVYPELRWQLTLYLGYNLKATDGNRLLTDDRLAKLARLPWFRYGYMPNWLRDQLIKDLPLPQDNKVRSVLKTLLEKNSKEPISDYDLQLDIAELPKSTFSVKGMFSALKQRFSSKWKKQSPKDSLRDYVFVTFMKNKVAVQVSENLHSLFFGNFQKYAVPMLVIFAITIWFSFYEWNFYKSENFCKLSEVMEKTCEPEPIPLPLQDEEKFFWLAEMVGGASLLISKPQEENKLFQALAKMAGQPNLAIPEPQKEKKSSLFQCTSFNIISSILRPTITAIVPSHVPQNSTADILVTAPTANFNSSSRVKIDDIVVNKTIFLSPSQVTANITIGTITPPFYDLSVETKIGLFRTEFTQGKCALEIVSTPDKPQIMSISPNKAELGSNIEVDIYGINTNFDLQSSQLEVNNSKITAKVTQVINANHLKARLDIAKTARVGFQKINIITGDELAKNSQLAGNLLVLSSLGKMRRNKISNNQHNSMDNIIRTASAESEFGNTSTHSEKIMNPFTNFRFKSSKTILINNTPLEIKVVANPKIVKQGENIIYIIKVINVSNMIATGIVLESTLSEGIRVLSIESLDEGNCSINSTSCELPNLMPNKIATIKIIASVTQPKALINTFTVTSNESPVNLRRRWTRVLPYLSVSVNDTPDPIMIKDILHYTFNIELSEYAPHLIATGIILKIKLPNSILFKSITNDYGNCDVSNLPSITCTINNLNKNDANNNKAIVNIEAILNDPGVLSLRLETKVSANEYPTHTNRTRTKISLDNVGADIALVIDTTASMQAEINAIIKAIENFIIENDLSIFPTFALVTFKDKDNVKIRAVTRNLDVLLKTIKSLKISGGGTCPEASMEALKLAISYLKKGGTILLSTDASPYDDSNVMEIAKLMRKKGIYFNAMISGACNWWDN